MQTPPKYIRGTDYVDPEGNVIGPVVPPKVK